MKSNKVVLSKNGFSLLEVLVFVAILSMFFVFAAAVSVASLRYVQINQHKIIATRYAQDLLEWVRSEREDNWDTFSSKSNNMYCVNTKIQSSDSLVNMSPGVCSSFNGLTSGGIGIAPAIYMRQLSLSSLGSPPYQVDASVVVSWNDFGATYTVPVKTSFSIWE